ncbi:MAG: hypothetical protein HUJ85_06920 [Veillonella sp.]|nr:hypothetical protein [Veillonella sp.]
MEKSINYVTRPMRLKQFYWAHKKGIYAALGVALCIWLGCLVTTAYWWQQQSMAQEAYEGVSQSEDYQASMAALEAYKKAKASLEGQQKEANHMVFIHHLLDQVVSLRHTKDASLTLQEVTFSDKGVLIKGYGQETKCLDDLSNYCNSLKGGLVFHGKKSDIQGVEGFSFTLSGSPKSNSSSQKTGHRDSQSVDGGHKS